MSSPQFSHDHAVKNLLKRYPFEAFEFLVPDLWVSRGCPVSVEVVDPAVAKDDTAEPGPGQAMDLAMRFGYSSGSAVMVLLVEHWSDAYKLDLFRTARYYLELCRRFPIDEILPIALVDDDRPVDLEDSVQRGAAGDSIFHFKTRIVQIPALRMEQYRETRNRVALSFTPNMSGEFSRVDQVVRVAMAFRSLGDMDGLRAYFAFWVVEGRLQIDEQKELSKKMKEDDMPEIIDWWVQEGLTKGLEQGLEKGVEKGLRQARLEDARRMLDRGCDWGFITDITGLHQEDLGG